MKEYKKGPHWSLQQRKDFAEALVAIHKSEPELSPRKKVQKAIQVAVPGDTDRSAPDQVNSLLRGKTMSELLEPHGIRSISDLKFGPKHPPARMRARESRAA